MMLSDRMDWTLKFAFSIIILSILVVVGFQPCSGQPNSAEVGSQGWDLKAGGNNETCNIYFIPILDGECVGAILGSACAKSRTETS